jgi:hypothetical protein
VIVKGEPALLAGWGRAEITPPIQCWMAGYIARSAPAAGVHDPLYARALAFGEHEHPFVLIVCDLLAVDERVVCAVRQRVPGACVWVSATHTHSGPEVDRAFDRVVEGATQAALKAIDSMRPVRAAWASGQVSGVATNRDHPQAAVDLGLDLLCLDSDGPDGSARKAILGSFGCHPTVLGADNLSISADLSGAFCRQLEADLGDHTWVALANGAGGDISTRHTRHAQTFEEVDRLAAVLAERARGLIRNAVNVRLAVPHVRERSVDLPTKRGLADSGVAARRREMHRQLQELQRIGAIQEARTLETSLQGLSIAVDNARTEQDVRAPVAAARLGEVTFASVPGELYNRLAAPIRQVDHQHVLLLGYANGYVGYIPDRSAYASDFDYEVLASRLAPGGGEQLTDALCQLMSEEDSEK